MKELLILLRSMQLFNHSAHHLVARAPFAADHELFGSFYSELDGEYDSVAERAIGKLGPEAANLGQIVAGVAAKLHGVPSTELKENSQFFEISLRLEKELCDLISSVIKAGVSEGTRQRLGDICDRSEVRQYKIQQRIKK